MNEESIFHQAVKIDDPHNRAHFLDDACGDDAALRAAVEALLKSHDEANSFLECPAVEASQATILADSVDAAPGEGEPAPPDDLRCLQPSENPDALGRLGQYDVLSEVGRGGLGVVLKARDSKLARIVAIKVPASEYAANAEVRKRFLREAEAAAAVSHDHVVTIHAVDDQSAVPYLVMEYVDGISLQEKIDTEGALELKEILRIGAQTARGLAAAHAQGLVHRDIKPANILLENGVQRVKITDFGLARAVDDVGMTRTGTVAGTPQYMSPEQAHAEKVDHRSDLFSLGSVLYSMCTGRPAFRADSAMAVLKRVCEEAPRPIRQVNPAIPEWLCEIVGKLLAKDPVQRFQSAEEVADLLNAHLAHLQQPQSVPAPPRVARPVQPPENGATRRLRFVKKVLLINGVASLLWVAAATLMFVLTFALHTPAQHISTLVAFSVATGFFSLLTGSLALHASRRVARRDSHAWALIGSVAALLPVNPLVLPIIPAVVGAIVVLFQSTVEGMFAKPSAAGSSPAHPASIAGPAVAFVAMFCLFGAVAFGMRGHLINAWHRAFPKIAPWEDFRWDDDVAYARIDGVWYEVKEIQGMPTRDVIVIADSKWADPKRRIVEDLVEVVVHMDRYSGSGVSLTLRELGRADELTWLARTVEMTAEKRRLLMHAIYPDGRTDGPSLAEIGSLPPGAGVAQDQ